ncbi:MAG: heme exporter protein CcmD [Pseudomonadota bacterium]
MLEFLAMGGYAAYVWTAFGLTFAVLWLNWWSGRRRHLRVKARLARQGQDETLHRGATIKEVNA